MVDASSKKASRRFGLSGAGSGPPGSQRVSMVKLYRMIKGDVLHSIQFPATIIRVQRSTFSAQRLAQNSEVPGSISYVYTALGPILFRY